MKTTTKQKQANEMLQKGLKQVIEAGIIPGNVNPEIIINTRASRRFGLCIKKKNGPGLKYDYLIEINHKLLEVEEKYAMETMVHETLHTVEGCMNHGPKWKGNAAVMNRKFGYNIKRTSSYSERGLEQPIGKYQVQCTNCKQVFFKNRMSNLIKNPKRYICSCKAKGTLEVVTGATAQRGATVAKPDIKKPAAKKTDTKRQPTRKPATKQPVAKTSTKKINKPAELGYKYTIECSSCGSQIGRRVASSAIKNISKYRCKCGNKSLSVIQNY